MPHPKKKQRMTGDDGASCLAETAVATDQMVTTSASTGDLSVDVLANILGFLGGAKDIMQKRRVCKKWKEAVKKTIVPPTDFIVVGVANYEAMNVMTRALPNLQQVTISRLGILHIYNDGEDSDEERAAITAHRTTHNIEIISNFSKLRDLAIYMDAPLNGRYPVLFNSFPLLQKLSIHLCHYLKWDLEMLAGMPMLKDLDCSTNECLTGNISSLRVLKDTLEKVYIHNCENVEGNFMHLADFPHLKVLDLDGTAVMGDIRDIGADDLSSLKYLRLPKGVYGGHRYEFQRISDAPDLIRAVYFINKQRPMLQMDTRYWKLSEDSPDWYESLDGDGDTPPFYACFVEAGSRIGYRWESCDDKPCEVNWLDPEPESGSNGYEDYIEKLEEIGYQVTMSMYKGFHQPPTEEEYNRLLDA